jgi:hypothetical protein
MRAIIGIHKQRSGEASAAEIVRSLRRGNRLDRLAGK